MIANIARHNSGNLFGVFLIPVARLTPNPIPDQSVHQGTESRGQTAVPTGDDLVYL
jgi:hypothetical protein